MCCSRSCSVRVSKWYNASAETPSVWASWTPNGPDPEVRMASGWRALMDSRSASGQAPTTGSACQCCKRCATGGSGMRHTCRYCWSACRQSCVRPTTTSSAPSANSIIETFGDSETTRRGVCICASLGSLRACAGGDEVWCQTGFAAQMDVNVRGEDILHHESFASAGLVQHLVGRGHGGGDVLQG